MMFLPLVTVMCDGCRTIAPLTPGGWLPETEDQAVQFAAQFGWELRSANVAGPLFRHLCPVCAEVNDA